VIEPTATHRRALAGAALALTLAAGCTASERTPHVESVRVADTTLETAAEVGLDRPGVEAAARAALSEAGFKLGPGEPGFRSRVELVALRLGPGAGSRGLRVDASVELELLPVDGKDPARREVGTGGDAVGADGPAGASRRAIAAAIGEAARAIRVGLSAEGKPVEALLADLESSDVRVRDHAVQTLGERRERRAVPGLVKRLRDNDRRVVERAMGALSQLKDPSAVPALIELSRGTDSTIALRLISVVGDIGGPDAEGWLLTLEQAHPDPRVQAAATEALADLHRRAGK
jgi:HEAT repeat protein